MTKEKSSPKIVFFSYSHEDASYRKALERHLALLRRQNLIETWHDREIDAGSSIDQEISENIEKAHVILLLISADFLASDYCYSKEMTRALARNDAGSAIVVPVILRPCDWHTAPFGNLKAVPEDGKPVTEWPNQDTAFADIARAIRQLVESNDANVSVVKNSVDELAASAELDSFEDLQSRILRALYCTVSDEPPRAISNVDLMCAVSDVTGQNLHDASRILAHNGFARLLETSSAWHIAATPRGIRAAWLLIDPQNFRDVLMRLRGALSERSVVTDLRSLSDATHVAIGLVHCVVSDWADRKLLHFNGNAAPWERSRIFNVNPALLRLASDAL